MTSMPHRSTIAIILAALALTTASASAMPLSDHTGSDPFAPTIPMLYGDLRAPSAGGVVAPPALSPSPAPPAAVERTKPGPVVVDDSGPSPFVYILPGVALIAMLGVGFAFVRTSRLARRSVA